MRRPFVAGNWKMNTDSQSAVDLAKSVAAGTSGAAGEKIDVAVIPPFVYLQSAGKAIAGSDVALGAQDVYTESEGAFTGEISMAMLKDVGCKYVLCGHSERRHVIGETDELVNKKLSTVLAGGLLPILCVGELIEQRQAGKTEEVITSQVKKGLADINAEEMEKVTIAYEPVWAIGTGLTASPEQAQQVHAFIRKLIAELYDEQLADRTRIQYGGSAKSGNAAELMAQADVDGLLVGGASLNADDFVAIINAAV